MAISYNLKFRKMNAAGRSLLEKEGEVILYEKGFRLKGKGAFDQGELVYFSDIKEMRVEEETLEFSTFLQQHFVLSGAGNLFDQFVHDLYKVRNEFLVEALFLRQGKLVREFHAHYERSIQEKFLSKGKAAIRLYEESMVIIPEQKEAFSLPFSFFKMHDFDEDEYRLKIDMETGIHVMIAHLGNDFEDFQELFYQLLSNFYSEILKQLQNFFMSTRADVLVKLANQMRRGRAVRIKDIQKTDKELADSVENAVFKDDAFLQTVGFMKDDITPENLYIGLNMIDGKKDIYWFSVMFALPEKNLLTCTIGSYEGDIRKVQDTYFFKIIEGEGNAAEEASKRVLELNQALTLLHFIPDAFYKDKRELKKSHYKLAIRKLTFLRSLRRSFLGRCPSILPELFQRNFVKFQNMEHRA